MSDQTTAVLEDGLAFPECPRWHDGVLWFSDMHAAEVRTVDEDGNGEIIFEVPGRPSGLGWMPDGSLLVVSQEDHKVLRWDEGTLSDHADLAAVATGDCNDMVVDGGGNAYVGNFGFDIYAGEAPKTAKLAFVSPDGKVSVAADDLLFPNGSVISPDGSTLVVGESFAARLTAFDVDRHGTLSNRRVWAQLESTHLPDGCCLDASGAIWLASPTSRIILRVQEGGAVTDTVTVSEGRGPFACMLGGADGRTLFCCTSSALLPEDTLAQRGGAIETVRVEVPHAGLP